MKVNLELEKSEEPNDIQKVEIAEIPDSTKKSVDKSNTQAKANKSSKDQITLETTGVS